MSDPPTGTEAAAFGPEFQALADAPTRWPARPGDATMYLARLRAATPELRAAVFADAERQVSPDIEEWNRFLRSVRARFPDVKVPAKWDGWDLRREMAKYGI